MTQARPLGKDPARSRSSDRRQLTQRRRGWPPRPLSKLFLYLSLLSAFTVPLALADLDPDEDIDIEGGPTQVDAEAPTYEFTSLLYTANIPENSMGKVYVVPDNIRMGIQCNDTSINIKYRIKSGDRDNFFKAESERVGDFIFLMIRTRTNNLDVLNRERRSNYRLDIRARVRGPDQQRLKIPEARTTLNIDVTDSNDLDPFFQPSTYFFDVPEDTPLHSNFGSVHAEDADSGINGEIYYSLVDSGEGDKLFAVDPVTGGLSLTRQLSFRDGSRHELTLIAQDRGAKSKFATRAPDTATVYITVTQVNLHDPLMQVKHLPEVIEHSNADIYAIIKIDDPDPGRHGEVESVEIVDGDPEAHFRVRPSSANDPKEFNIEVLQLLDREISPQGYNLTLKAVDRGIPPRTAYKNVHVRLGDFNDHPPVFDREVYEVSVNESAPVGTPIARLKVTDEDSGLNAKVRLNIVAGNKNGQFRMNPSSGVLYIARPLDAEYKASYTLTVTALDQANTGLRKQSSAKVRILVTDTNDNDPVFEDGASKEIAFDENEPPGTKVYKVKATDADSGENGYISYSLANLDDVPFEIDHFTGTVKSTKLLDYESEKRFYVLKIRASDWGSPFRRQAELKLTIRLRDINDNRPQFERIGCTGKVSRTTTPGSQIFTLSALDFDAGSMISYRLVSGNSDGCFALDPTKGILSVVCDLRTLPMRRRELNVTATDGQHFSDVTPITIRLVNDEDDDFGSVENDVNTKSVKKKHRKVIASPWLTDSSFECKETDVAKRLTTILHDSERNNLDVSSLENENESSSSIMPSRFGSNIHRPEIENLPSLVQINETVTPGMLLFKMANQIDVNSQTQELHMPKNVNKLIHPIRMIISGPSMSGKSTFIKQLVQHRKLLFSTEFTRIIYCVPATTFHLHESFFSALKQYFPKMEFLQGLPRSSDIMSDNLPKLVLMDDLMSQIFSDPFIDQLFKEVSHHTSCSIIFTSQNYFSTGNSKTIIRNCNYKCFFNDASDKVMLRTVGCQISPSQPNLLNFCFEVLEHYYPNDTYSYIIIDSHAKTANKNMLVRSKIFPHLDGKIRPLCFFVNPEYKK